MNAQNDIFITTGISAPARTFAPRRRP